MMKKTFLCALFLTMNIYVMAQEEDFPVPDKIAEFPGGAQAMQEFISKELVYPEDCRRSGISGLVMVRFVVYPDSTLNDITIYKSPDDRLSREAIRVIKLMPKWHPALLKEKPVKMRLTMPIKFGLTRPVKKIGKQD